MLEGKKQGSLRKHFGNAMPTRGLSLGSSFLAPRRDLFPSKLLCWPRGLRALSGSVSLVHESESQFNLFVTNVKEAGAKQPHGPAAYSDGLCLHSQSQMCLISKYETILVPFIFTTFWRVRQSLWGRRHIFAFNLQQ